MSSPKERHYWSQLRAALTAGQWRNEFPAKAYNGSLLSWSELFRKFKKHCRGFEDVAVVAEQTRLLAVLLGAKYKDDDENAEIEEASTPADTEREGSSLGSERLGKVDLEGECILDPERFEEAEAGYETLQTLQSSRFDTLYFALAYYAYALGNPKDCLQHLAKVPELLQFLNHIPSNDSTRSNGLLAPSTYAPSSTTSFSGSFTSIADFTTGEVRDGRAWAMAETIRSLCLKGMSQELLHPTDLRIALKEYNAALPLFPILRSEFAPKILPINSSSTGNTEFTLFVQLRELWRWVEKLLWRAIVLSAKVCDIFNDDDQSVAAAPSVSNPEAIESIWVWFAHYTSCSALWPALFRTRHRSTISVLYLRALVLRFGILASLPAPGTAPVYLPPKKSTSNTASASTTRPSTALSHLVPNTTSAPPSTSPTGFQPQAPTQSTWMGIARSVVQDHRAILNASTSFPRAGERNVQVEDFVELCIKVWEAGGAVGEQVGWVIDILNWSQRLTFNSSLVLRHLTRLLYIGSAPYLAKRTLYVYIQVVGKAWEASKHGVGEDKDDDVRWVETLVFGARMLCAGVGGPGFMLSNPTGNGSVQGVLVSDDGTDGIDEVLEASAILEKARWRLDENDKRLQAEVLLAEGIVWSLLGIKCQDPLTRPVNFDKAHVCLLRSIQAHPTPSAYYHLALSFARRVPNIHAISDNAEAEPNSKQEGHEHNITRAIECAGQAVEGSPNDVRCWHLLGLLLSATEKWVAAKEILERGSELDDNDDTDGEEGEDKEEEDASGHGYSSMETSRMGSEDAETVTQMRMEAQTLKVPNGVMNSNGPTTVPPKTYRTTTNGTVVQRENSGASRPSGNLSDATPDVLLLQPEATSLPPSSSLRHPTLELLCSSSLDNSTESSPLLPSLTIDQYPPSTSDLFERHLQLRMTQVVLLEVVGGPEGAEQGWLEIFSWVAEKRGVGSGTTTSVGNPEASSQTRHSLDDTNAALPIDVAETELQTGSLPSVPYDLGRDLEKAAKPTSSKRLTLSLSKKVSKTDASPLPSNTLVIPVGIKISPATPELEPEVQRQLELVESAQAHNAESLLETGDVREIVREKGKEKSQLNGFGTRQKRSLSIDRDNRGDSSKSKKVQQILKGSVHKGRAGITAVSKKIGHEIARNGVLRRSTSNPDFYAALRPTSSYQASSIHSRRRLSSIIHSEDGTSTDSPPPPPPPALPSPSVQQDYQSRSQRSAKENRLLSDLWLMSAATFRRLGKTDQAKGAIQEAEVKDENNPNVWVQLGLYYIALGMYQHAVDALQKAKFISFDNVPATVHLARLFLDPDVTCRIHSSSNGGSYTSPPPAQVNLSAPTTGSIFPIPSNGTGWDVPEAWYFLAKAYGMQGRKDREKETLKIALEFSEKRG
ncbi:hypothetical protein CPB84DRAFT_1768330 [Gymnopilus junonius]|uniref:Uncharacterized protein n=1 Tax=Gymnopilus junonius TaxID=109634 RepID=A0A9P5NSV7_GYMJU|nr:hypothetical protein CPB84DRAFT_1768330 [Gymnopilus junonius]